MSAPAVPWDRIIGISHLCNVVWPESYLGSMEVAFKFVSFDFMEVATPECFISGWTLTWDGRYLGSIAVTAGLFVLDLGVFQARLFVLFQERLVAK